MGKAYKDYIKDIISLPDQPDVLRVVDSIQQVVYYNLDAAPEANIIMLITPLSMGFCCSGD